ncbi:NucA/NucB deoxyribonuclease domain-containing protein [Streptomyces chartreusis]|uniref:NucA/NucB deoxyribonuclease domain-containing protein n=1 Tax=Streptomyces chartreusis TaxID=1969 RepID=UPI0037FD5595
MPGQKADEPLTRLYHDEERRKKNRNRSVYNCTKYFGDNYTQGGAKQCDEYPFATTYQGAVWSDYDHLAEPNNFSVLPVLADHNRDAGILLGQYYDKNRIIDGPDDGFIVQIVP